MVKKKRRIGMTTTSRIFNGDEEYFRTPKTSKYWVPEPNIMYCESIQTSCDQHNHRCVGYVPGPCPIPECDRIADIGWGSDDEGVYWKPGCIKCKKQTCSYHHGNEDNLQCMECNGGK